ncbi:hypothetical protein JKX24_15770 [Serratia proteamaculans]|uniref:Uncharacterized protein n=1 Tax=Serratia proteamaculans TaxID=28151 RepID=A0A7U0N347_SERPR|nr:hypothetical protein [Serratia proteamaculans]MBO1504897.1 hypothetical protein [Serratia proteamaculans]QQX51666.1 hypothetical protein JKX24_15770 [Serratia proteamaculans]
MARGAWLGLLALVASFAGGWQASEWHRDSLALAIDQAAQRAGEVSRQASEAVASHSARQLENKIEALRDAQPKEIRTEVVKPVFTNVCVSDEFIRLYNDAADKAERAISGKFTR